MNNYSSERDEGRRTKRRRVLLVSEAVTLAQITRLAVLGSALGDDYDVHYASASFPDAVFDGRGFRRWVIDSVNAAQVDRALRGGRRLYDRKTLEHYLEEDLAVIDAVRPDLIVGDLRWTLTIAAPLRQVPLATLINAYWHPGAIARSVPLPEHPITRLLGEHLAARYFPIAAPHVFRHFVRPLNELRRRHGLSDLGSLPDVLMYGDYTLLPDTPAIAPIEALPSTYRYLGPVHWAPAGELPPGWGHEKLAVYVTLGSSGAVECLPIVLEGLSSLDVDVLVATAGRYATSDLPAGVRSADFVPGDLAVRRAAVVVCNGGSSTGYQALQEGAPVVGVPHNLDQYLAMGCIERAGAGALLRSGTLSADRVAHAVRQAIEDDSMRAAAKRVADDFDRYSAPRRFARFVRETLCEAPAKSMRLSSGDHLPASDPITTLS